MRKKVMAVVFAILAFSLIAASAASLGGITVDPEIGADAAFVGTCDDDGVTATFSDPTYDTSSGRYVVASVTIGDIAAPDCVGQTLQVEVTDSALNSIGSGSVASIASDTELVTFGSPVDAEALARIAVSISG